MSTISPATTLFLLLANLIFIKIISDALYIVGFVHLASDQSCITINHSLTWSSLNLFKAVMSLLLPIHSVLVSYQINNIQQSLKH